VIIQLAKKYVRIIILQLKVKRENYTIVQNNVNYNTMDNITIDVIMAFISDDYEPTNTELLILRDIVRDQKQFGRASAKEFDSVSIMEIFDYKIKIDPDRLSKLSDKKRLLVKNNRDYKIYKQKF
jgi:hypothetical protein